MKVLLFILLLLANIYNLYLVYDYLNGHLLMFEKKVILQTIFNNLILFVISIIVFIY